MTPRPESIAISGASGFVGGSLLRMLCARGLHPRALSRDPARLEWARSLGAFPMRADALDRQSLDRALDGVEVAYYLVHSMDAGGRHGFVERDRLAARNFAEAAAAQGVRRIIYLGGLGRAGLSAHLASRAEVGEILQSTGVPVTVIGAGIILGAGSASFRMLVDLTTRLPIMITPRWVHTRTQPVALDDIIRYLAALPEHPETSGRRYDVGTPEVLTYAELIRSVAALSHRIKPLIVPVPVLTPRLSSYWVNLVTSVHAGLARPLIEGLSTEAVAEHPEQLPGLLGLQPTAVREAILRALGPAGGESVDQLRIQQQEVTTTQRVSFATNLLFDRIGPPPEACSPQWLLSSYLSEVTRRSAGLIKQRWHGDAVDLVLSFLRAPLIRLGRAVADPNSTPGMTAITFPVEGGLLTAPGSAAHPSTLHLGWWRERNRLALEARLDVVYRPWLLGSRRLSTAVQRRVHSYLSMRALRRVGRELARQR